MFIKSLDLISYHNSILEKMFLENKKNNEEFALNINNLIYEFEDERLKLTEPVYAEFRNEFLKTTTIKKNNLELIKNELSNLLRKEYDKNPADQKILSLYNKIYKIRSKIVIQETSRIKYSMVLKNIIEDMDENISKLNSSFASLTKNKIHFIFNIK
jgi:hypothetical protein